VPGPGASGGGSEALYPECWEYSTGRGAEVL
jgi:hypothetical protein